MTTDHMELRAADRLAKLCDELPLSAGWITVPVIDLLEVLHALEQMRAPAAPQGKYSAEFEEAWNEYPKRPGASKAATWKAWQARIKAKVSPEAMVEGARRYAAYCKAQRTEPAYIKQPATFFGPGEHYDADWGVPRAAEPRRQLVDRRQQMDDEKAAASAAAKARLLGHRPPPPDDGMTFEMERP